MANIYNYNSKNYELIIGKTRVDDYADDTKITIEYDGDFKSLTKGVDGARSVNQHNDYDAVIKFKILQNSPLNLAFKQLALTEGDKGTFSVTFVNKGLDGTMGAFSAKGFFKKIPTLEIGTDAKGTEWEVQCINLKMA
ncbi:phage structural protein [Fusobacterium pseudoperiodonticum]|uniref:DUF3277 domain-containing protein n=1 Tax=Fusobacterium pseudoperiodonticum TaxID=2663009 RepID=A0AAD0AN58_9FUSO|nr:hypothetical protein [Fusobacterium pseudoperiodonticum]ATV34619.1 hypothetical protein CTM64_00350 [Fusobacterium pseudoperiodonticum]ATV62488.1 hypothetical protein CTM74_11965 [Fusobacterium pseudoperiodonticum]